MKKMLTYGILVILIIILIYVIQPIVGGLIIGGAFSYRPNKNYMEKELNENKEIIVSVIEYLINLPYDDVYITKTKMKEKGTIYVSNTEELGTTITINDNIIANNVNYLLSQCKYGVITKDDNTIAFQRWCNLNNETGIAYSIDGHIPNEASLQFLTKLEPLKDDKWFYYEEDFNEWRIRNQRNENL